MSPRRIPRATPATLPGKGDGVGRLDGRVAIVTGSNRGIGRAIAGGFAAEGATVVINGRDPGRTETAAREIVDAGGRAIAVLGDVRDRGAARHLIDETVARLGTVDILVNNAGVGMVAPSEALTEAQWRLVQSTNVDGAFYCSQAAARVMLERRRGVILNIESLLSFTAFPSRLAYAAAKGGLRHMTMTLGVEWADRGVRVVGMAPGMIRTELQDELVRQGKLDRGRVIERTPMKRMGEVEDLIGPAVFLVSDDAAFVTAQTLVVDGGFLAYGYL